MPSLKRNFGYNVGYQVLSYIVPLVTAPYLSRVLGPDGIGGYSMGYSVAYYFSLFALLGVSRNGTRSIASVRNDNHQTQKIFWELYFLQLITSAVAIVGYIGANILFLDIRYGWVWLPFLIASAIDITWLFFGEEDFKVTVMRASVVKLITLVGVFALVRDTNDLWVYVAIMSFGQLLSFAVMIPFVKRYIQRFIKPTKHGIWSHMKSNIALFVPQMATETYRTLDKVLLGILATSESLGFFSNAEKVILVPLSVLSAMAAVMLPRMTNIMSQGDSVRQDEYIRAAMDFSLSFGIGLAFGVSSVANELAVAYFGESFQACAALIAALSITVPFVAWATVVRELYLIPAHLDRIYVVAVLSGAVCNLILNIALIPEFGAWGSCVATLITEVMVCFLLSYRVFFSLNLSRCLIDCIPFLVVSAIMALIIRVVAFAVQNVYLAAVLEIITGVAVFGVGVIFVCRLSNRLVPVVRMACPKKLLPILQRKR